MNNVSTKGIGFFVLIIMCFIMCAGAGAAQVPPTTLSVNYGLTHVQEETLGPGDSGTLIVVIQNTGGLPAEDVTASILYSNSGVSASDQWNLGTINPGIPVTVTTRINTAENVKPGTYLLAIKFSYTSQSYDSGGALKKEDADSEWRIPIKVTIKPSFLIKNLSIPKIEPGDKFKIGVTLINKKTDAFDVSVRLNSKPGITILGSDIEYLGDVSKDKAVSAVFELYISDDAIAGAYTIPLNVDYEDKEHNKQSDTFSIGIYAAGTAKISLTDAKTDPEKVYAGDENVGVKFSIENHGTAQVKNLKIILNPVNPFKNAKSYEQSKSIGILSTGGKSDANFYINVDENASPGKYNLNFISEYSVNNEDIKEDINIPVIIDEKPVFKFLADEIKVFAGEKRSMKIRVTNTGEKCDAVKLFVLEKSDQPFDFEDKTDYIGDLDRNDEGEAMLKFSVDSDAKAKSYSIPVEIRCVNGDNVLVDPEKIIVAVIEGESSNPLLNYGLIAIILLVAGILYFFKFGNKK